MTQMQMRLAVFAVLTVAFGLSASDNRLAVRAAAPRQVFYAAIGPELTQYSLNTADATLTKVDSVTVPFAVQYVWPHPSKKFVYVAWSNGMQGDRHGVSAFRVDRSTGALTPRGTAI